MFSHPVADFGKLCIVAGIVLAVLAVTMYPEQAYLLLTFSAVAESLGFFLLLLGVIAQGFIRIERYLAGIPDMKAAFDASAPATSVQGHPFQKKTEPR